MISKTIPMKLKLSARLKTGKNPTFMKSRTCPNKILSIELPIIPEIKKVNGNLIFLFLK